MIWFVAFGVLATCASLANCIEPLVAPPNATYQSAINEAASDIFDKSASDGLYPSALNIAALDIFDKTIRIPTSGSMYPVDQTPSPGTTCKVDIMKFAWVNLSYILVYNHWRLKYCIEHAWPMKNSPFEIYPCLLEGGREGTPGGGGITDVESTTKEPTSNSAPITGKIWVGVHSFIWNHRSVKLYLFIRTDYAQAVSSLIQGRMNVNEFFDGETVLHIAAAAGNSNVTLSKWCVADVKRKPLLLQAMKNLHGCWFTTERTTRSKTGKGNQQTI